MHSQFLGTVFLALCIARGVLSAPLEITHPQVTMIGGVPDQEETENLARIEASKNDANRLLVKMEHVLDNPTVPQNAEMIHAAFGKNAQIDEIKKTVQTLRTGTVPVQLPTYTGDPHVVAMVDYDTSVTRNPAPSRDTHFGQLFHNPQGTANMRAATLIHEASHKLANTGDEVDLATNKMILGNDFSKSSTHTGYATHIEPATTPAQLNADKAWVDMRDGTGQHPAVVDMHNNAESYAQLGSMCDTVISNAEVGLRRRAMEERDWNTAAVYLIKRQACMLRKKGAVKPVAAKNAKHPPTEKAKLSAVSKLAAKKSVASAAGKKTTKGVPVNKLSKSRLPSAKTVASKKMTLSGARGAASKTGLAHKTLVKPTASETNIVGKRPTTSRTNTRAKSITSKKNVLRKKPAGKTSLLRSSKKSPGIAQKSKTRVASAKFGAARPKTASRTKPVAASKTPSRAKSSVAKKTLSGSKASLSKQPLSSKKTVAKKPISRASTRAKSQQETAKSVTRKAAKPTAKRPLLSKASASKPVTRPAVKKQSTMAKSAATNKRVQKSNGKAPSNLKKPASKNTQSRVAKAPTSKRVTQRLIGKPASSKHVTRPAAQNKSKVAPRPAVKSVAKKAAQRPVVKKAALKPIAKKAAPKPVSKKAVPKPVAKKAAPRPTAAAKRPPPPPGAKAKAPAKKGRRDLEFQL